MLITIFQCGYINENFLIQNWLDAFNDLCTIQAFMYIIYEYNRDQSLFANGHNPFSEVGKYVMIEHENTVGGGEILQWSTPVDWFPV